MTAERRARAVPAAEKRNARIAPWRYGSIHRALRSGVVEVEGPVYGGLGLVRDGRGWWLIHLNTGHAAGKLYGSLVEVLPAATRVADVFEWDAMLTLMGWRQICPDLPQRLRALKDEFGCFDPPLGASEGAASEGRAKEIAHVRA